MAKVLTCRFGKGQGDVFLETQTIGDTVVRSCFQDHKPRTILSEFASPNLTESSSSYARSITSAGGAALKITKREKLVVSFVIMIPSSAPTAE